MKEHTLKKIFLTSLMIINAMGICLCFSYLTLVLLNVINYHGRNVLIIKNVLIIIILVIGILDISYISITLLKEKLSITILKKKRSITIRREKRNENSDS